MCAYKNLKHCHIYLQNCSNLMVSRIQSTKMAAVVGMTTIEFKMADLIECLIVRRCSLSTWCTPGRFYCWGKMWCSCKGSLWRYIHDNHLDRLVYVREGKGGRSSERGEGVSEHSADNLPFLKGTSDFLGKNKCIRLGFVVTRIKNVCSNVRSGNLISPGELLARGYLWHPVRKRKYTK